MTAEGYCCVCGGKGDFFDELCVYCNGTGEWSAVGDAYMKNHICQCIHLDRLFCPICEKKCHHDASLNPKQKIDSGYGGISTSKKYSEKKVALIPL